MSTTAPSMSRAISQLASAIDTPKALRTFTESHVFCVFDFMALLKSLQRELTCVSVPWLPVQDAESARLIGEIVLGEESDIDAEGRTLSHFEWYLEAMKEIGSITGPIERFVAGLRQGASPFELLMHESVPQESAIFTAHTFRTLEQPLHVRAASFLYGREDLIPALFLPLVRELGARGLSCGRLVGYLERHIEVDGEDHGPRARALLEHVCQGDPTRIAEADEAADDARSHREELWQSITARLLA